MTDRGWHGSREPDQHRWDAKRKKRPVQAVFPPRSVSDRITHACAQARRLAISDAVYDAQCEAILAERDATERAIFAEPCTGTKDLNCLVMIAAYFDWMVPDFNTAVRMETALLAAGWEI